VVTCLELGADLRIAQLMPQPLTVSCFSKIKIGFTFLVPAHPGSPRKRAVKRVCVLSVIEYLNKTTVTKKFHTKISHNASFSLLLFIFVHIPPIFSVLLTYSLKINILLF